jgi:DNA-directed RNA polymerase specialized sigma24 family protein
MAKAGHKDSGKPDPAAVPPFWLPAREDGGRRIDERVLAVARANWPWAYWLVKRQLRDGTRCAEIVEDVAADVSRRLGEEIEVGRNLNGYFRTSLIRRVRTLTIREGRIRYEGGARELEANHRPSAPGWTAIFEDRMALMSLLPHMSHPVRHMLHCRLLKYSWRKIAHSLGITEKQAKSRFYYGARRAYEELLSLQAERARAAGSSNDGND